MHALLALAAGAALAESPRQRDDPRARLEATRAWRGETLESRWRLLQEATRERDRWSIGRSQARLAAPSRSTLQGAPVQGTSFVNLGPTSADFQDNGGRYFEVDSGRARQIVVDPIDPKLVYLSTAGGGVWRSWDGGQGWEPITDALGTTAIGTFAIDPQNPDIFFIGFGDPFDVQQPGIVRSGDAGATWSAPAVLTATYAVGNATYTRTAGSVMDLKIDPRNSAHVLVATDAGLFRSIDGGGSWAPVPLPPEPGGQRFFFLWSLAWTGGDNWLVVGQISDPAQASDPSSTANLVLFRSTDAGASWTWHGAALPDGDAQALLAARGTLAVAQGTLVEPGTSRVFLLLAAKQGTSTLDLLRSDDGGATFQALGLNSHGAPANPNLDQPDLDVLHGQAWYNQALLADPADPDTVFVGGDLAMLRSQDGGLSWSVLSDWLPGPQGLSNAYVHADFHAFAAAGDGALYAGSDGGIFSSTDARSSTNANAVTFTSAANRGLVTHLVLTVACAPDDPAWPADLQSFIAGGMQDNGTRIRAGSTTVFNQVLGGDGIGVAVGSGVVTVAGAHVPELLYASAEFDIFLSHDGGYGWDKAEQGLRGFLPFFVRVVRDVRGGDTFLTFTDVPAAVYRSVAAGPWQDVSGKLNWPSTQTTGFVTPTGQPIGLRNLATHPNELGVWAAASNRFTYVTIDGGATWTAGNTPQPPGSSYGAYMLSSIAFDPDDPADPKLRTLYATSLAPQLVDANGVPAPLTPAFGHIYKSMDSGRSWISIVNGLPNVGVDVLKVDPSNSNVLYAGTQLGLYRSIDKGASWTRFGAGSLPLVEVRDLCITASSKRLTAATYGRGFWQISTDPSTSPAGVRGVGDTNFDGRIDGLDLIDLADAYASTQASPTYRWQADLTGSENRIDDQDVQALLAKFGNRP